MSIPKRRGNKNELAPPTDDVDAQSEAASEVEPVLNSRKQTVFDDFLANSTVHGVRYFSERKRHWTERLWWIIALGFSLLFCGFLIHKAWTKWDHNPVVVGFAEKTTSVSSIPFPAVTICSETKAHVDKLNIEDAYNALSQGMKDNMTEETLTRMQSVTHLCDGRIADLLGKFGQEFSTNAIYDIIKDVAPTIYETMVFCRWRDKYNFCNTFFLPILTEEGICFTFNSLNSRDIYTDEMVPEMLTVTDNRNATNWNLEAGYNDREKNLSESYPFRVIGTGDRAGLEVNLQVYKQDMDYLCRGAVHGFKIFLHTPGEVPQLSKNYFRVPLFQGVSVTIKPQMMITSDGLRHYSPNRRQCYLNSERQLRFFKVYTQGNCELECLSNFTLTECGCVKYSMPRDRNTSICGFDKITCYNDAKYRLLDLHFVEVLDRCNCLPTCTSITYDAEVSQGKLPVNKNVDENSFDEVIPARCTMFFKDHEFITLKRSELYGFSDFVAGCGGLLGLFLGVSVLSIVEVIYYFTLRLGCTLCTRQSRKRKSPRAHRNSVAPDEKPIPNIMVVN